MPEKMLKFTKLGQQNPPKREVLDRKDDFNEIYNGFISDRAKDNPVDVLSVECPFAQSLSFK